jgi:hypothetical protein
MSKAENQVITTSIVAELAPMPPRHQSAAPMVGACEKPTRRIVMGMLASTTAAVAVAAPSLVTDKGDPVFAAIEAHQQAEQRLTIACTEYSRVEGLMFAETKARLARLKPSDLKPLADYLTEQKITFTPGELDDFMKERVKDYYRTEFGVDEAERRNSEACHAAADAAWRILDVPPTTVAGVAALVHYALEGHDHGRGEWPDRDARKDEDEWSDYVDWEWDMMKTVALALDRIAATAS